MTTALAAMNILLGLVYFQYGTLTLADGILMQATEAAARLGQQGGDAHGVLQRVLAVEYGQAGLLAVAREGGDQASGFGELVQVPPAADAERDRGSDAHADDAIAPV